jgi:hypothetical protein
VKDLPQAKTQNGSSHRRPDLQQEKDDVRKVSAVLFLYAPCFRAVFKAFTVFLPLGEAL